MKERHRNRAMQACFTSKFGCLDEGEGSEGRVSEVTS